MSDALNYFEAMREMDKGRPELPLCEEPCSDCAVTGGLYLGYAVALSKLPEDLREDVSRKWFCHNDPSKACRGNANICGVKPK